MIFFKYMTDLGSPPRMRGKQCKKCCTCQITRITPADAGKTIWHEPECALKEDHPRGCGENHIIEAINSYIAGSPPRMRGKQINCFKASEIVRITPADAGKTILFRITLNLHQDHPRGCGENLLPHLQLYKTTGSPPRMRGKLKKGVLSLGETRITPADAGKT